MSSEQYTAPLSNSTKCYEYYWMKNLSRQNHFFFKYPKSSKLNKKLMIVYTELVNQVDCEHNRRSKHNGWLSFDAD